MRRTWEWWEFFPASISPFGFNESAWFEYFPIEKEKAIEWQFPWYEKENNIFINWITEIPDNIDDVNKTFINQAIKCKSSWKTFKIIHQELEFYKKYWLPLPRKHPDYRHLDRFNSKPKRDLHIINCFKCNKTISSVFEKELNVYCESCYEKEIY